MKLWLLAVSIVSVAGTLWFRRACHRRRMKRRFRRAKLAEERAEELLERAGFKVLESQPEYQVRLQVGWQEHRASIRPDFLVRRRGRRFIVEVKSGRSAPDPLNRHTRRQLREYWAVLPFPVLLLDAETGVLRGVDFLDTTYTRGSFPRTAIRIGSLVLVLWLLQQLFFL